MGIPITTGSSVPGQEIEEIVGLVFGAGNAAFGLKGTASKAGTALNKAEENLAEEARVLGANAVVNVTMSLDGSGSALNRSQTVTLLGTAVRTKKTNSSGGSNV